ncbi:PepSY domain-containing protein [Maribacter polysiphoniae]|uniref:PepSY domain-containing protein n=1 Tax=Maribacter polysiphoniae TaxID=429344 RepID=A0A316E7L6_9FLAO|nr:PepSY-associated TM helix domain-containing protein [Maribacter polysiphoniae]MBD1259157.1 PepSY domain-containing protein [Maribacter polysiphoniae]PWK24713.1 PepSY-associated transmembrane protein [Maribacter polysiphoniae]
MTKPNQRIKQARILRIFRKIHRITGAALFIFFFIVSITALLLGWKKHSNGILMPETYVGTSTDLKQWLPLDSLHTKAIAVLHDSVAPDLSPIIDRIDVRKEKGAVKFIFKDHFWGIQLDGATGKVLHIDKRYSDLIENVHDGSILDWYFNTSNGQIKVIYSSIMGIALLIFTITGFWLWYGPKKMRKSKSRSQ